MEQNHMLPRPANRGAHPAPMAGNDQKHSLLQQEQHRQRTSPPPDHASIFQSLDRPFKLPLYPPPSYSQTNQDAKSKNILMFPSATKTELAPIKSFTGMYDGQKKSNTLPSLSALTATTNAASTPLYSAPPPSQSQSRLSHPPEPSYAPPPIPTPPQPTHWPSLNPFTAYYTPSHAESADSPMRMEVESTTNSVVSAASPRSAQDGRASSVSLDDPDVRLAAEALGDLRADFVSSPPNRSTPLPRSPRTQSTTPQAEPLLNLLTTQHPFVGQVIEGTTSAYNASKNYSPRFRTSAEYVEGYVAPIASTVGTVGRATGVEGGVRWFLGGGRRTKSDLEAAEHSHSKRRRVDTGPMLTEDEDEPMGGAQTPRPTYDPNDPRRLSIASTVDTLPAYDEYRSPAYTETPESRPTSLAWQSRLIMSTSGLSIAMSEESLRSLKYCLSWLRWANVHIGNVIDKLKVTMEKYEEPLQEDDLNGSQPMTDAEAADSREKLAANIARLRADVLKTLQDVITTVSKYAGGALPENARDLVRRHLMSLPQRFRVANMVGEGHHAPQLTDLTDEEAGAAKDKETKEGAQRVLVLAKEGLDMMTQVSGVLDGTIVSAEEWCERIGRKRRQERESLYIGSAPIALGDDKMELRE